MPSNIQRVSRAKRGDLFGSLRRWFRGKFSLRIITHSTRSRAKRGESVEIARRPIRERCDGQIGIYFVHRTCAWGGVKLRMRWAFMRSPRAPMALRREAGVGYEGAYGDTLRSHRGASGAKVVSYGCG